MGSRRGMTFLVLAAGCNALLGIPEAQPDDALLATLQVSAGTLDPPFTPIVEDYRVAVPLGVQTFHLVPASSGGAAVIRVDTVVVASGAESAQRTLALGDQNLVQVVVSGASGKTRTYRVTVERGLGADAYVKASNTGAGDHFGRAVAASGHTLAVGAPHESSSGKGVNPAVQTDDGAASSGAVYVIVASGPSWSQQAFIKAANAGADDVFGSSVALDGDTLAVGAPGEASSGTDANPNAEDNSIYGRGAVYVFVRSGSTWSQQAYLKPATSGTPDFFGNAVALSGDTLVVGAAEDPTGGPYSGAAYVFVRSGQTWSRQATLRAANAGPGDRFGTSVAVSGDTVVVGAPEEMSNGPPADDTLLRAGAAYVFARAGSTWTVQAYLKAGTIAAEDSFGASVGVSGDRIAVGAPGKDTFGAAFAFVRNGAAWTQEAEVRASNPDIGDGFGGALALAGSTLVVGAADEEGNGTGVNPMSQADNSLLYSGAAYVFVRDGTRWPQEAYLKAPNPGVRDQLGTSIALGSEALVIGAPGESSKGTGVGSTAQADDSAQDSGAAYIFRVHF